LAFFGYLVHFLTVVISSSSKQPLLLSFDHVYPDTADSLQAPPATAIFYAAFESSSFYSLHRILYEFSSRPNPPIQYVLRHATPSSNMHSLPSYLSGYGVSLDLKKMDYLALDDRRGARRGMHRPLACYIPY